LRENISAAQKFEGGSIKCDIAVPVSRVAEFIAKASAAVTALIPGTRVVAFGHIGDGNIHFNPLQPAGADKAAFLARWDDVTRAVHDLTHALGGSISAEHGVGRLKRGEIRRYKAPLEIELMTALKRALDPDGILNPGKLL
jgi:FAD/FMN-containing dehydrogenase